MALKFFLRNIGQEIQDVCQKEGIDCHDNFIAYYLELLALDPIWNLFPNMKEINRLDAVRLIKFVVTKMKNQFCPCIISLKTKMYFSCNFEEKEVIANNERINLRNRMKPLEDEIVEQQNEEQTEDLNLLRKKMIFYITLWRGLGNPTDALVYKEAKQVLASIYDDSDILSFIERDEEEKRSELFQLAQICCGIRIFNMSCDKGGAGMENLPFLLKDVSATINDKIVTVLTDTMEKINYLTSAVDFCFKVNVIEQTGAKRSLIGEFAYNGICELPFGVNYEDMEYIKDLIIVFRQLEVHLRTLMEELVKVDKEVEDLDQKLKETLDNFNAITYLKVGVPTDEVFPIFITLDQIWCDYQNNLIYAAKLNQILHNLQLYVKDLQLNYQVLQNILSRKQIRSYGRRHSTVDEEVIVMSKLTEPRDSKISLISDNEIIERVPLEFLGFCPWKLVESQGGLIPGNPRLGIYKFMNKYYAFSEVNAATAFAINPTKYINEVLELARKKTELIPLLQLEDYLKTVQLVKELVLDQVKTSDDKSITQIRSEAQTETHPIKSKIDKEYMWNIWDWKRQAICLANMSKKKTSSCQTEFSNNKNPVYTQTYEEVEKEVQTMKDNYTNVPTPQTYFFGLRGRKDGKQFILNLTRPIDD